MTNKNVLDWIAIVLVIIGGLNWGLVSINPDYNLVQMILGGIPALARIVYALVGLSAIYMIYYFAKK